MKVNRHHSTYNDIENLEQITNFTRENIISKNSAYVLGGSSGCKNPQRLSLVIEMVEQLKNSRRVNCTLQNILLLVLKLTSSEVSITSFCAANTRRSIACLICWALGTMSGNGMPFLCEASLSRISCDTWNARICQFFFFLLI